MLIGKTNQRAAARTLLQVLTLFVAGLMMSAPAVAADAPATGQPSGVDAPRYATPLECPRFATPQFISRPLEKAYPGLEYSMRPAIKGGEYPYTFTLAKAPPGMKIDAATGAITWLAPAAEGIDDVTIAVKDTGGRAASQSFKVNVSKAGFYFLSPDGDDSADGSMQKPWKTMMRAATPPDSFTYPKGAVIILRGGDYKIEIPAAPGKTDADTLQIDGRSPKYWLAYPGEKPVIDLGWSKQQWEAVHQAQKAAGKFMFTIRYGHRIALVNGSNYLYMDGLEVKNACYYMFVMWDGRNTIDFRRMNLHDLWGDYRENPSFIFTFAGERTGNKEWGVPPQCKYYENFVIQDCWMHDRYFVSEAGGHGGAMTFYTVRNAVVEDNVIDNIYRGDGIMDKEDGYDNTYRGNVVHGAFVIGSTYYNDEIEVCDNYIDGEFVVGLLPGWVRNIWVHNNTIRGPISLMRGDVTSPDKFDPTSGNFVKATTADSAKVIREFPMDKKLIFFYRNVVVAPADGMIVRVPYNAEFAARWRYVYWDQNVVDSKGKVDLLWAPSTNFSIMKKAGFDTKGFLEDVKIDAAGRLPADSPHAGKYGRGSGTTMWETRAAASENVAPDHSSVQTPASQPAKGPNH